MKNPTKIAAACNILWQGCKKSQSQIAATNRSRKLHIWEHLPWNYEAAKNCKSQIAVANRKSLAWESRLKKLEEHLVFWQLDMNIYRVCIFCTARNSSPFLPEWEFENLQNQFKKISFPLDVHTQQTEDSVWVSGMDISLKRSLPTNSGRTYLAQFNDERFRNNEGTVSSTDKMSVANSGDTTG